MDFWNEGLEIDFFKSSLKFATINDLFYKTDNDEYFAYWPDKYKGKKSTLQSRNALIGNYTETWCQDFFKNIIEPMGYYSISNVTCPEIGLPSSSKGDLAILRKDTQEPDPEDILILFEIKMSLVWNWTLTNKGDINSIKCSGDYTTHQGSPSLQRSDSMLKAIGKGINVKVSSSSAAKIPYIVIGNTPIRGIYPKKVDYLKTSGVIQGFWSLNPNPLPTHPKKDELNFKETPKKGYQRIQTEEQLSSIITELIKSDKEFFSSMNNKDDIGRFIEIANREDTYVKKAERFINLIRG